MRFLIGLAVLLVSFGCERLEPRGPGWQTDIEICLPAHLVDLAERSAHLDLVAEVEQAGYEWHEGSGGQLVPVEAWVSDECPQAHGDGVSALYVDEELPEWAVAYAPTEKLPGVQVKDRPVIVACDLSFQTEAILARGNEACFRTNVRHELAHCYTGDGAHTETGLLSPKPPCGMGITPNDVVFVLTNAGF